MALSAAILKGISRSLAWFASVAKSWLARMSCKAESLFFDVTDVKFIGNDSIVTAVREREKSENSETIESLYLHFQVPANPSKDISLTHVPTFPQVEVTGASLVSR